MGLEPTTYGLKGVKETLAEKAKTPKISRKLREPIPLCKDKSRLAKNPEEMRTFRA